MRTDAEVSNLEPPLCKACEAIMCQGCIPHVDKVHRAIRICRNIGGQFLEGKTSLAHCKVTQRVLVIYV